MSRADRSRRTERRGQPTPRRSRTPIVAGAAIAVVVVAAVVAVIAVAFSSPPGAAEPAARVTITGDALPAFTDPAADPAIGQALPTLVGVGLDGETITIGPEDGPVAIAVLAHWCPHCQNELPGIAQLIEQGGVPEGVKVVALSTSIDPVRPNYPPSTWFEREGWTQPTLIDDANSSALAALGLSTFPGFVFVDGDGAVALRLTGEIGAERFGEILSSLQR